MWCQAPRVGGSVRGGRVRFLVCADGQRPQRARQPRCAHRDTGLDHEAGPGRAEGSRVVEAGVAVFQG
jgi:hypothetical protein